MGLATADSSAMLASPLRTIAPHDLVATIESEGPFTAIVVGLPRGLDGQDTLQTTVVRRFCDDVLWRRLHIEPIFQDEAGTSGVAQDRLRQSGKAYDKAAIDAEAAAIILQDYLDSL